MEYEVQISAATNESYALKVQVKVTSSTQERGRVFSPNRGDTFDVPLPLQLCKTWMHALSHSILIHKTQNGKHFNPEYVSARFTSRFPIMVDPIEPIFPLVCKIHFVCIFGCFALA